MTLNCLVVLSPSDRRRVVSGIIGSRRKISADKLHAMTEKEKSNRPGVTRTPGSRNRCAVVGEPLADNRKVDYMWQKGRRRRGVQSGLRVGTVNVGTMRRREGEVVEMMGRRSLDFLCVQETRRRGRDGNCSEWMGGFKFFWSGGEDGGGGVGILMARKWVDNVIGVERLSGRMIVVRVAIEGVVVCLLQGSHLS